MSPVTFLVGSLSHFFKRELRLHHLHWFWLPIVLYFILGIQYYQANVGGTGIDLPLNLVGWGLIGVALAMGLWGFYHRGKVKISRQIILMGLLITCLFVPLTFIEPLGQSSTWFRFIALPLIWLLVLMSLQYRVTQKTQIILVTAIAIGTSAQTVIGVAQMTVMDHPFRPFGHFQQTNLMASYMTTGMACLFWLIAVSPKLARWRWITLFAIICLLAGVVGAQLDSRAMLPYGVMVAGMGSVYGITKKQYAPILLLVAFVAGWFGETLFTLPKSTIAPDTTAFVAQDNVEERLILYPQVVQMIQDNMVTGVGYGHFESAYVKFSSQQAREQNNSILVRHNMAHPHNEILYWAVEGGILAALAILSMFVLLLVWLLRKPQPHKPLILALFLPITAHTFIEYPLHSSLPHLLVLLIFVRLFVLDNATKYLNIHPHIMPLFRPLSLLIGLAMSLFSATGLHTNKLVLDYELAAVKTPAPYLSMINPFVHYERYWTHIMAHKALAGMQNNDHQAIEEYIIWAEEMVAMRPRKIYWDNIIRLKHYLNQLQISDCQTYELYFPPAKCESLILEQSPQT